MQFDTVSYQTFPAGYIITCCYKQLAQTLIQELQQYLAYTSYNIADTCVESPYKIFFVQLENILRSVYQITNVKMKATIIPAILWACITVATLPTNFNDYNHRVLCTVLLKLNCKGDVSSIWKRGTFVLRRTCAVSPLNMKFSTAYTVEDTHSAS